MWREPRRPVSRVLYPSTAGRTVTIYLAYQMAKGHWVPAPSGTVLPPRSSSQPGDGPGTQSPPIWPCSRWGLAVAASPKRPDALTVRFHPYPSIAGKTVCFCATFRPPRQPRRIGAPPQKPGRYPAPCPEEPGLSSPASPTNRERRGGHPAYLALLRTLAQGHWRVKNDKVLVCWRTL